MAGVRESEGELGRENGGEEREKENRRERKRGLRMDEGEGEGCITKGIRVMKRW